VDNTENRPTVLSLCTGYGGLELGLEGALRGVTTLAHVEVEAFAVANLVSKMETGQMVPAPIWTDLKTFRAKKFRGCVDILTGGYPCQPFSAAGKRAGTDDPRHLWPYIKTIVADCEPRWVFFENVEGHISLGISEVLADLEEMGYTVTAGIFSAAEVGAPHQRKRVFILAYSRLLGPEIRKQQTTRIEQYRKELGNTKHLGPYGVEIPGSIETSVRDDPEGSVQARESSGASRPGILCDLWPARPGENQHEWEEPRTVADSESPGRKTRQSHEMGRDRKRGTWEPTPHKNQRKTQSGLGRAINGPSSRVDRLRLLGNGVVPQVAGKAFLTLYHEMELKGGLRDE